MSDFRVSAQFLNYCEVLDSWAVQFGEAEWAGSETDYVEFMRRNLARLQAEEGETL